MAFGLISVHEHKRRLRSCKRPVSDSKISSALAPFSADALCLERFELPLTLYLHELEEHRLHQAGRLFHVVRAFGTKACVIRGVSDVRELRAPSKVLLPMSRKLCRLPDLTYPCQTDLVILNKSQKARRADALANASGEKSKGRDFLLRTVPAMAEISIRGRGVEAGSVVSGLCTHTTGTSDSRALQDAVQDAVPYPRCMAPSTRLTPEDCGETAPSWLHARIIESSWT